MSWLDGCQQVVKRELDVVTFNPKCRRIVHIEPSMDAQS